MQDNSPSRLQCGIRGRERFVQFRRTEVFYDIGKEYQIKRPRMKRKPGAIALDKINAVFYARFFPGPGVQRSAGQAEGNGRKIYAYSARGGRGGMQDQFSPAAADIKDSLSDGTGAEFEYFSQARA